MRGLTSILLLAFLATTLAHAAPSCRTDEHRLGPYAPPTEKISDRPDAPLYEMIVVSPGEPRLGYSIKRDGKSIMVIDGVEGRPYSDVHGVCFSPDGRRYIYAAKKGNKWVAVIDGVEGQEYDGVYLPNPPVFSADGRHVVYVARLGEASIVVRDGVEGKSYQIVDCQRRAFSDDGKHLAYVADNDGKYYAVIDGVEKPLLGRPQYFCFSADLHHFAYAVIDYNNSTSVVVVDGVAGPTYERQREGGFMTTFPQPSFPYYPVVSPDWRHLAYCAWKNGRWIVVVDGVESPEYDIEPECKYSIWTLAFSADSRHVAYTVADGKRRFLVLDGKEIPDAGWIRTDPWETQATIFAPAGGGYAYAVHRDKDVFVVLNGVETGPYTYAICGVFSPDGRHYAFLATRDKKSFVVLDGTEQTAYDQVDPYALRFSADGRHLGCAAQVGDRHFVVVDGKPGPEYTVPPRTTSVRGLTFSPDGRHHAYFARTGPTKEVSVLDGVAGPEYDRILEDWRQPPHWSQNGIDYLAVRDGIAYRVHQSLPTR
jgi:hypothetical protein